MFNVLRNHVNFSVFCSFSAMFHHSLLATFWWVFFSFFLDHCCQKESHVQEKTYFVNSQDQLANTFTKSLRPSRLYDKKIEQQDGKKNKG